MKGNPVVGFEVNWCIDPNVRSIYLHPTVGDQSGPQCRCIIPARWLELVRRLRKRVACHKRHKKQHVCESEHCDDYLRNSTLTPQLSLARRSVLCGRRPAREGFEIQSLMDTAE